MDKLNKLSLPATILIASLILGGFIFASQVIKQQSIERQQQIELEAKERQQQIELKAKAEQDNRNYIAKRKLDCLAIYKTESDKFNNIRSWNYKEPFKTKDPLKKGGYIPIHPIYDMCEIIYKDNKTGEDFSKYF